MNIQIHAIFFTSNMRSSICEKYTLAAIILANKQTSLVTSGVTLGLPVIYFKHKGLDIITHDFCSVH